jgi:hypothetical protein
LITLIVLLGPVVGWADQPRADDLPRTEFGYPDLQGVWHFGSRTPLQRPVELGTQRSLSAGEVARREAAMQARLRAQDAALDPGRSAPEKGAVIRQEADDTFLAHYAEPTIVPVDGEYRTSVLISPENGRVPVRAEFMAQYARAVESRPEETAGPEGQPLSGRCLLFGSLVPSLTPIMMNPNMQIVQTADHVMVMTEMVHDARVIPLNRELPAHDLRRWMGYSAGRWEGDTLVVNSRGFRPEQSFGRGLPVSAEFELEERYTLVSRDAIRYEFTARDPVAFSEPVIGVRTLTRNRPEEQIYEFACHEGNYSLEAILRGARRQEADAREASGQRTGG